MPFANYKMPQDSLTVAQKEDLIHKTTDLMVSFFGEVVRPTTMVLVEEVKDGGYGPRRRGFHDAGRISRQRVVPFVKRAAVMSLPKPSEGLR